VHAFGHDFDRYVDPVAMTTIDGRDVLLGPATVHGPDEVSFEVPRGIGRARVWLEDTVAVHDVNAMCLDLAELKLWEVAPGDSCAPGAVLCQPEVQSKLRTIDLVSIEVPPPPPTNLVVVEHWSNAVLLSWSIDPRDAAEVEVEYKLVGGAWETIGRVPAARGQEPIFNLVPGNSYVFRIRAVATGALSPPSNEVSVSLPRVRLRYLDSKTVAHPFYSRNSDMYFDVEITGLMVMFDGNGDGIHPQTADFSDVGNRDALYPAFYNGATGTVEAGARYAPGANVIVLVVFDSYGMGGDTEFATAQLDLGQAGWSGVMTGGNPYGNVVMGAADLIREGELEYRLPSHDEPYGVMRGWFENAVFMNSVNNTFWGTQFVLEFPDGLAINDENEYPR